MEKLFTQLNTQDLDKIEGNRMLIGVTPSSLVSVFDEISLSFYKDIKPQVVIAKLLSIGDQDITRYIKSLDNRRKAELAKNLILKQNQAKFLLNVPPDD